MEKKSFWRKLGESLLKSLEIMGKYFGARLLTCLIISVLAGVAYYFIGLSVWWLWAFIVGIANMIPIFGPWVSYILITVYTLVVDYAILKKSPMMILWALLVVLVAQILDEFIFTPVLLGRAIDLKPLVVFAVVIAAGSLCGFWGMLFALPVAACVKAVYNIFFRDNTPTPKEPKKDG